MKFTNGYWLMREGVTQYFLSDVRDTETNGERVTLYVAPWKIHNRGQTLGGPLLTLSFTSPKENILHIRMSHYEGAVRRTPSFEYTDDRFPVGYQDGENEIVVSSGKLAAYINKETFQIEYRYDGRFLTASVPRQMAYMTTAEGAFCRERLQASVNEYFYGFGEYFTPFVKNGQVIDIWNEDGGTASEQAYKTVPFYISTRGYGVFADHPEKVSFEVCSEVVSKVQFSVPGEELKYMVIGGDNPSEVVSRYTELLGRPALPPAWSFGLWLSTSFTTEYNEKTVTSFIDGMANRDIPLSVFHFDCFWMKEYQWCNFAWDTDAFPDPEGMLKRLKDKGLKICLWINPYIGQRSPLFAEGAEKGYLIKNSEGGVWQWDLWQPGLAIVDFTNPGAVEWYKAHLRRLMDMGVDCFKTDFGERIPADGVYHDGSCPLKMHNFYSFIYNKAVFEVVEEVKGKNEAVLFARSATAGGQRFPVHWGGDCDSNYESMAESLRGGLSLSLCGFGFWSHDIGGFENTATPDVYKRWVAFGLFSSHSRLHGSISYRVPWLFDDEAVDVLRHFTRLKSSLMPYIFATAVNAHRTGIPTMRPMVMQFPSDPVCPFLDTQYMFGDNLLVAPVFNDEGTRSVYLPKTACNGLWTNFLTGEKSKGGVFVEEKHDYFSLGLWVPPNSVIPMGKEENVVYMYSEQPILHVFEAEVVSTVIYNPDGTEGLKVTVDASDGGISFDATEGHGGFSLLIRGMTIDESDKFATEYTKQGTLFKIPAGVT